MEHKRKSIRLKEYNYANKGAYYITICTHERKCLFGKVIDGKIKLSEGGKIVNDNWIRLPKRFPNIEICDYIIMPNHIHGVIMINGSAICNRATIKVAPTLGNIIGAFKSITTNEYINNIINQNWPQFNKRLWQRNYYEHIIRNETDLYCIRKYIENNPLQWKQDTYYAVC